MDISDYFYAWKPALFRKKTRGWTIIQRGIYRELIDEYMLTREPLPDDDNALAEIARVPIEIWLENKSVILAKFDHADQKFSHEHCDEELEVQDKRSKTRTKASKKAAATRWKHKKKPIMPNECESDAKAMPKNATGQDRTVTRQDINIKKNTKKSSAGRPEEIPKQLWDDFQAVRKAKSLPLTPTALDGIRREAEKIGYSLQQAITTSCENGWAGFKAEWIQNTQPKGNQNHGRSDRPTRAEINEAIRREVLESLEREDQGEEA